MPAGPESQASGKNGQMPEPGNPAPGPPLRGSRVQADIAPHDRAPAGDGHDVRGRIGTDLKRACPATTTSSTPSSAAPAIGNRRRVKEAHSVPPVAAIVTCLGVAAQLAVKRPALRWRRSDFGHD